MIGQVDVQRYEQRLGLLDQLYLLVAPVTNPADQETRHRARSSLTVWNGCDLIIDQHEVSQ